MGEFKTVPVGCCIIGFVVDVSSRYFWSFGLLACRQVVFLFVGGGVIVLVTVRV